MPKATEKTVEKIISNPFYCMTVAPVFCEDHEYLISREEWIKANVNLIKEMGAEKWLKRLIENLEGNYE